MAAKNYTGWVERSTSFFKKKRNWYRLKVKQNSRTTSKQNLEEFSDNSKALKYSKNYIDKGKAASQDFLRARPNYLFFCKKTVNWRGNRVYIV